MTDLGAFAEKLACALVACAAAGYLAWLVFGVGIVIR